MRKIPTIFRRDPNDMRRVANEVDPSCQWVINGRGTATRKYDGTCVMLDELGRWWARREVKPGKTPPPNYRPIETDPNTAKTVGWEPIEQSPFAKVHQSVVDHPLADIVNNPWDIPSKSEDTYELIGAKVNGNPEKVAGHRLQRHADAEVLHDVPRDFDGLAKYLADFDGEGIVWHHEDGRMAKLKRRDFGY